MIAVVDDDLSVRRAVARFLTASGLDVATFASASAFLATPHIRPKCLVADVEMPGMSGLDLKAYLAHSDRDLPVIFITAHDDPQTRERAEKLGAAGFLRKPFDGAGLLESITRITESDVFPGRQL